MFGFDKVSLRKIWSIVKENDSSKYVTFNCTLTKHLKPRTWRTMYQLSIVQWRIENYPAGDVMDV